MLRGKDVPARFADILDDMAEVDPSVSHGGSDIVVPESGDAPSRNKEITLATLRLSEDRKRMLGCPAGSHIRHTGFRLWDATRKKNVHNLYKEQRGSSDK